MPLIVIEGLDGSGKATNAEVLARYLEKAGRQVVKISFPDYGSNSSALIKMYLGGEFGSKPSDVNAYAASAFYAVDRYASFMTKWKSDYESGKWIIADRYTTSNAVHQASKLDGAELDEYIDWLYGFEFEKLGLPKPDTVIYLDLPTEVSQKLMSGRYGGDETKKDIHESDFAYLEKSRATAKVVAKRLGWQVVDLSDGDGICSKDEAARRVIACFEGVYGTEFQTAVSN